MTLKEQHDLLLTQIPEGAVHDTEGCPFCNPDLSVDDNSDGGGDMKTYTEEEFTAAVTEAVAPLQAAAEAKANELQSELEALKATLAKGEAEGQIAELQTELDKAEIRATEAAARYDELVAYLAAEEAAKAEAAELEARRDARLAALKENTPLSDERIAASLDRFVAMDDEAFEAILEDYKAVSAAARDSKDDAALAEIPAETAMSNVRDEASGAAGYAGVFAARNRGLDVRYI